MVTLSLAMIVRDEALSIERVLASAVSFCDEMVIVDTGSTDQTVAMVEAFAQRHPEVRFKIEHFEWVNDFSAARNYAFSHCTGDWIMWLDGDDFLAPEQIPLFAALKNDPAMLADEAMQFLFVPYVYNFDRQTGQVAQTVVRERFIRNHQGYRWNGVVHETIEVEPTHKNCILNHLQVYHDPIKPKNPDRYLDMITSQLEPLDTLDNSGFMTFFDVRYYFYQASELLKRQQYEAAIPYFEVCMSCPGRFREQYLMRVQQGRCHMGLRQYDQALDCALDAIRRDASRAEAYMLAAECKFRDDRFLEAIPLFQAATYCRVPDNTHSLPMEYGPRPLHYLASCYSRVGELENCIDSMYRAMREGADLDDLMPQFRGLIEEALAGKQAGGLMAVVAKSESQYTV
ncbi:MAG: glycosyltransferase [Vampirovibrionales bacterium]